MIWLMEILKIYLTASYKAFNIAKNLKYDEYLSGLALHKCGLHIFFDKKSALLEDKSAVGGAIKNEAEPNEKLAEELHKPIIKKFKKCQNYSPFKNIIWGTDLADMKLISKFNK